MRIIILCHSLVSDWNCCEPDPGGDHSRRERIAELRAATSC